MKFIAASALLFCLSTTAWGAGYQLRYQGAESMGTAFSSAGSYGQSLSSIYYNPALFLTQGKDKALSLELMVINPTEAEFVNSNTPEVVDDFSDPTLSGAFYYGYKVDENTAFTVAVTTPWGTSTDYGTTWGGRYAATETDLMTVNVQPMISKKLSDQFMFSIGPQIQYMAGKLGSATSLNPLSPDPSTDFTSVFDGDNMSVGGVLALTYMPTERTTIGFNYTSRVKHRLKGDLDFSAAAAAIPPPQGPFVDSDRAGAEIVTPEVITLSASQTFSEKLIGHFAVSYTNWSVFKSLDLSAEAAAAGGLAPISTSVEQNWEDTYMVSAGTTFMMSEKFILRGGLSYETGAVENQFRTPRSQDTDRIGIALGTTFALGSVMMDVGLNHIIYTGDVEMDIASDLPSGKPGVEGVYDVSATLLRVGAEYRF